MKDPVSEKSFPGIRLAGSFGNKTVLEADGGGGMERMLAGMAGQRSMNVDRFFDSDVTQKMLG